MAAVPTAALLAVNGFISTAPHYAWVALGAYLAGLVGVVAHWATIYSGAAWWIMGDAGEQWTRAELAKAQGLGWRAAHQVRFRGDEDIDSVALGPAGVLVVETKWSGDDWNGARMEQRILDAARQARHNADVIERQMRQQVGSVLVRAVVVLWSPHAAFRSRAINGVNVLDGHELHAWIKSLAGGEVASDTQDAMWRFLAQRMEKRLASDLARFGPGPRTIRRWVVDLVRFPMGLLVGLLLASVVVTLLRFPTAVAPLILGAAAFALGGERVRVVRPLMFGLSAAFGASGLFYLALVAIFALR